MCPECGTTCKVHDTMHRDWIHLNFYKRYAYIHAREPRIKCHEHCVRIVDVPWGRKGSGFTLSFEAKVIILAWEMSVFAVARTVQIHEDYVWRILKDYVAEVRKDQDLSDLNIIKFDEFSVGKHHIYVTLFYDIKNSRVVHTEEGEYSDMFMKFTQKIPFLDVENIDHITMDMYPLYTSSAMEYFPSSRIVVGHFHVIKMMNDTLDRIRRKESGENAIPKHTRYDRLKNPSYLSEKERDCLMSVKSLTFRHHMHIT